MRSTRQDRIDGNCRLVGKVLSDRLCSEEQSMNCPKVLHLSFTCMPGRGSEPGVGWNRAVEASKYCDVWVLCREQECKEAIGRYLRDHGEIAGLHFSFLPRTPFELALDKVPGLFYLSYNLWHRRALRAVRKLHEQVGFDLMHQVTYVGYREPGYLWKMDVPFVWGPLGGTQNYPWRFWPGPSIRGATFEALRNICNRLQLRHSRRTRLAAKKAATVVLANSAVQRDLRQCCPGNSYQLIETGIASLSECAAKRVREDSTFRILWSGNIEHRKALEVLIEALARFPSNLAFQLRVLGSGPLEKHMRRLAKRRGLENRVEWLGRLPHEEALAQFQWADAFAFTSLRETTGTVILESLGAGVPVVCFDHQGARDAVSDDCGIKVPVTNRRQAAELFRDALARLARDRQLVERLSAGALVRAHDFLWHQQGEAVAQIYRTTLERAGVAWHPRLPTSGGRLPVVQAVEFSSRNTPLTTR